MKNIFILLAFLHIFSCSYEKVEQKVVEQKVEEQKVEEQKETEIINYLEDSTQLLKGDWVSKSYFRDEHCDPPCICIVWTDQYRLSFDNKTFLYAHYGDADYKFTNDTLRLKVPINHPDSTGLKTKIFQFKVNKTSDTTAFLVALDDYTRDRAIPNDDKIDVNIDTILFTKLTPKNNIKPIRIGFHAVPYLPYIYAEIDENRNIYYYEKEIEDTMRGYLGRMDEYNYSLILKKIHQIQLDSLKSYYPPYISHGEVEHGLIIETADKTYQTIAYSKTPIALDILTEKLMRIKEERTLIRSENVYQNLKFRALIKDHVYYLERWIDEQ